MYVAKSIKNCQNVGFVRCAFTIRCICVMHYQICDLVYLFFNQIVVSLNRNSPGSVDLFLKLSTTSCASVDGAAQLQKQECWTLCGELLFQIALSKVKNKYSSFNFTSLWLFSSDRVQLLVFIQHLRTYFVQWKKKNSFVENSSFIYTFVIRTKMQVLALVETQTHDFLCSRGFFLGVN